MSNPPGGGSAEWGRTMLGHVARTLADLGSEERQRLYKQSVPFVHVPIELSEQCATYRGYLARSWFRDLFEVEEVAALRSFLWTVWAYCRAHRREWRDVDQGIFDDPAWRVIMTRASALYESMMASGRLEPAPAASGRCPRRRR